MNKIIIGFAFIYGIVLTCIPYYLYKFSIFTNFITYIANVDLIANVLATNFPDYFKLVYNITPESIVGYISFNIITLIALSGIFLYGLQLKLIGYSNSISFRSMIIVSIITFTLPTLLIPYFTKYFKKYSEDIMFYYISLQHEDSEKKKKDEILTDEVITNIGIFISMAIATAFIFIEGYIIEHLVHHHKYTAKGRRLFGTRHNNPIEYLIKGN